MPTPRPRTDLPDDVAGKLANLNQRVRMQKVASGLYKKLLTDEEQGRVKETPDVLARLPEIISKFRGYTIERTIIELAMEAIFIDYGTYRSLRREIGEPIDESQSELIPIWDPGTGKLVFDDAIVRQVKGNATSLRLVLDAFQELGWPSHIDNPLPGGVDSNKLRETLRTLNKGLSTIRFRADGKAAGILWQVDN